jgi:eukaryotic-like serine/threonine-protein kinase
MSNRDASRPADSEPAQDKSGEVLRPRHDSLSDDDVATVMTVATPSTRGPMSSRLPPVSSFGHYTDLEFLGQGGMAKVFKAHDQRLGRTVALKFIRDDDPRLVGKLLHEARAQARVEHPYACKVYEVGEINDHPYIAMQYIDGSSLSRLKAVMTLEQKVSAVIDVALALHAAHRIGLIHRDVKPSNIMVERSEDGRFIPYIMDFGIAREVEGSGEAMTETIEGTPGYMAPEQATGGAASLDRRTDVYSLGATLYDLLTGAPPFRGGSSVEVLLALTQEEAEPLRKRDSRLPVDLETIVMKCLEKDPSRRYESTKAIADDLQRFLDGEPILARRASIVYWAVKKAKRHKLLVAVSAVALAGITALSVVGIRARYIAAEQAEFAQLLGQELKEVELFMRQAYALPLHDIRREKAVVRERMARLAELATRGYREGPILYALGQGHLVLDENEAALSHFTRAAESGYRTPDVERSIGLAMGKIYEKRMEEIERIADKQLRDELSKQIEEKHLKPALRHLMARGGAAGESPLYAEALVAFYEKRYDVALSKVREAFERAPWAYQAKKLEGDILTAVARSDSEQGRYEEARADLNRAEEAYRIASDMARSDPTIYEAEVTLFIRMIEADLPSGIDIRPAFQRTMDACEKALAADPDAKGIHTAKAIAYMWLAPAEFDAGASPTEAIEQGIAEGLEAIKRDPNDASAHDAIGNLHLDRARYEIEHGLDPDLSFELARQSFEASIRLNPSLAWPRHDLGRVLGLRAWHELSVGADPRPATAAAIESLRAAIECKPSWPKPYLNLCMSYRIDGMYEADHGIDPSSSYAASLESAENGLKMNPAYASLYLQTSLTYVARAEHEMDIGGDAGRWLELAAATVARAEEARPNWVNTKVELARVQKQMTLLALETKRSPEQPLERWRKTFEALPPATKSDPSLLSDRTILDLATARWAIAKGESGDAALASARDAVEEALRLHPENTELLQTAAALELFAAETAAKEQSERAALALAGRGLAWMGKLRLLNDTLPRLAALEGALYLVSAKASRSAKERSEAARLAEARLEEALLGNRFLERKYRPLLDEAKRIGEAIRP